MSTLLVSLGTSPAVVPEAFLLPGVDFTAVHVLTTESTSVELVIEWFRDKAADADLTITRVSSFTDFRSEEDHFRFEEVLYRWWLEKAGSAGNPYVCLSGGFKTMSAAMQKAAAVLGAAEVFHVLADSIYPDPKDAHRKLPASTSEQIEYSRSNNHLHWIRLGPESGWPQFRFLSASEYPLEIVRNEGVVQSVAAPDAAFRHHLRQLVERSHNISDAWGRISSLPFPALATWSAEDLAWLDAPLDALADQAWIKALPKVELHCHLGGFASHGDLLEKVRAAAMYPEHLPILQDCSPPADWPAAVLPQDSGARLKAYMNLGDNNGSRLLRDPGCLAEHCRLLFEHLVSQNIVYAEIRCSPANYASEDRSPWTVLSEIKSAFDACVTASVPLAESVATSVPLDGPRQFTPFEKDADYHQTWRDLPHRHQIGATAFVTFRLADSLPAARLQAWHREQTEFLTAHPKPWDTQTWQTYRRQFPQRLEEWLDEPHGECLLRQPEIAAEVESALRYFDGDRYILDAFVIMPNHVHVLVKPLPGHNLEEILHSWKSYTAHRINKQLARTGQLWEHESFDHLLRSAKQLQILREYIRENPRKAGLVDGFIVGMGTGLVLESSDTLDSTVPARQRPAATCRINLIIIATRKESGDYRTDIARHLSLAVTAAEHWAKDPGCRVVGVDLAGYEDTSTRAHYFREEFTATHRNGLAITIHAGENDDAEGIWSAILDLNARRLGHALHLADSPTLLKTVADRRIGIEMCPYANLQIKGFPLDAAAKGAAHAYPLLGYLQAGVSVTVNTDNIGISAASLTDNFMLLPRLCPGITRLHILQLMRNAIDQSFLSAPEKAVLLSSVKVSH